MQAPNRSLTQPNPVQDTPPWDRLPAVGLEAAAASSSVVSVAEEIPVEPERARWSGMEQERMQHATLDDHLVVFAPAPEPAPDTIFSTKPAARPKAPDPESQALAPLLKP